MSPHNRTIARTIAATAATTLVFTAILFFFYYKFCVARHRAKTMVKGSFRREDVIMNHAELKQPCRNVKESSVHGNGIDVVSMSKLEDGQLKTNFPKFVFNPSYKEDEDAEEAEEKRVDAEEEKRDKYKPQEAPLLHEPSSDLIVSDKMGKSFLQNPTPPAPISVSQTQQRLPPQRPRTSFRQTSPQVPKILTPLTQLPPQSHPTNNSLTAPRPPQYPPPPPSPPPPPPLPVKPRPTLPPPVPSANGWISSRRTQVAPKGRTKNIAETMKEESSNATVVGQTKLKPLHWDKVTADVDHSTVWDEINDGSLRFDDELMENLFGYSTTNRQSYERSNLFSAFSKLNSGPPTQIFILDPRKSQNTAIVLRSLAISRREILDALMDGQELGADTLEKLTKISTTQEEAAKILQFSGNPSRLADAESFLYHILKAVPSAFARFNAMLFRANYDPEILHFKESLQTLELGCQELRARGLFLKLLEAILKAGNRMNAGTARGNAQGFNLNALKKLSDIRSNDGKTTLLHFVVEQVARSEGKRSLINPNETLRSKRINTQKPQIINSPNFDNLTPEEREREYLLLGLPMLESLSSELSNVKRAATVEYDTFVAVCSSLGGRVAEIRKRLSFCQSDDDQGWFAREMKGFLEECEEEIKVVREEQIRVLELVKKTTEYYYQAGASKENGGRNPFGLFVIVKDFLDMVDQVCVDTSRRFQKRNAAKNRTAGSVSASPPVSPPSTLTPKKFQNFRSSFMSDMSLSSSSSESEDDF
ncbi:Formin, FH2 domain containing protein [Trema orientale]|uniref:Formin-like protein n=1 Tax=Trema orientale TaxID=63057 RepID=A0A2P5EKP2_TREOI|nr:Formin, FH2 domain containing protein [Trema orientale]